MYRNLIYAALVGYSAADPHSGHPEIDAQSTKELGLVKWQHFFNEYVENSTYTAPSDFNVSSHLCWFQFRIE